MEHDANCLYHRVLQKKVKSTDMGILTLKKQYNICVAPLTPSCQRQDRVREFYENV